jgi:MbtH protein
MEMVDMANPFDNEDGVFLVLVNVENQHSLWPAEIAVPSGWTVAHAADTRAACLEYVELTWTDLRPASLVAAAAHTSA